MLWNSTKTASFCIILIVAIIFSLSPARLVAAQANISLGTGALFSNTTGSFNIAIGNNSLLGNTIGSFNMASGVDALFSNTTGSFNTASGIQALFSNTTGIDNTAVGLSALLSNSIGNNNTATGLQALLSNTTGSQNTAVGVNALSSNTTGSNNTGIGFQANVSAGNLTNAMAIGAGAIVNASNKIRLGNSSVTVIEGQVAFTASSDKTKKENFRSVDGEEVLRKIRGFELTSWNFIGHDPKEFRHYGPMAQDFFAAFGHDEVGKIGTETTINSGDMEGILMIAVQALEKRTTQISVLESELKQKEAQLSALELKLEQKDAQISMLGSSVEENLKAKQAYVESLAARLDALELLQNRSIHRTADKNLPNSTISAH